LQPLLLGNCNDRLQQASVTISLRLLAHYSKTFLSNKHAEACLHIRIAFLVKSRDLQPYLALFCCEYVVNDKNTGVAADVLNYQSLLFRNIRPSWSLSGWLLMEQTEQSTTTVAQK
jgi:hypothetical protein